MAPSEGSVHQGGLPGDWLGIRLIEEDHAQVEGVGECSEQSWQHSHLGWLLQKGQRGHGVKYCPGRVRLDIRNNLSVQQVALEARTWLHHSARLLEGFRQTHHGAGRGDSTLGQQEGLVGFLRSLPALCS